MPWRYGSLGLSAFRQKAASGKTCCWILLSCRRVFFFPPAGEVQRGWLPACSASLPRGVMWKRSGDASWVPRSRFKKSNSIFKSLLWKTCTFLISLLNCEAGGGGGAAVCSAGQLEGQGIERPLTIFNCTFLNVCFLSTVCLWMQWNLRSNFSRLVRKTCARSVKLPWGLGYCLYTLFCIQNKVGAIGSFSLYIAHKKRY